MNIVIALLSGNEIELIDAFIEHHLSLGVSGIVIADLSSTDGTAERLRAYADDPRVLLRFYEEEDVLSDQGLQFEPVWAWTLEAAREHFAADWVLRIDTDEFLLPEGGDLKAAFARHAEDSVIEIPRYNAVHPDGPPQNFPGPPSLNELYAQNVVVAPKSVASTAYVQDDTLPLVLTAVIPKVAAHARRVANFTMGGHGALNRERERVIPAPTSSLALVHFWFTTFSRFARKARHLAELETKLRPFLPPGTAWQWGYWAGTAERGPAALAAEYARQFPGPAEMERLRREGIVARAGSLWSRHER